MEDSASGTPVPSPDLAMLARVYGEDSEQYKMIVRQRERETQPIVSPTDEQAKTNGADIEAELARQEREAGPLAALQGLTADSPDQWRLNAVRQFAEGAAQLAATERMNLRSTAIGMLERIGVKGPAKLIDTALAEAMPETDKPGDTKQDGGLFADPPPWDEPVDGRVVLSLMTETYRRYLIMPDGGYEVLALWTLYTHAFDSFDVAPYLAILSPTKRCGKSTVIRLLARMVRRGLEVANMSSAVLFRLIDTAHPTLLLDEADAWLKGEAKEELRGLMNAGHDRGAKAYRCAGDDCEVVAFDAFGPRAIAAIGRIQNTIEDRSIVVRMRRRGAGERVEKLKAHRLGGLTLVYRKAARWALDNAKALREADPDVPNLGSDRAEDNWRVLLAVADTVGGDWPRWARSSAKLLTAPESDTEASGVLALADIRALFAARRVSCLETKIILDALHEMDTRPWGEWGRSSKPITGPGLARLLSPFDVEPDKWRSGDKTLRGYKLAAFQDAFTRYLPPADSPHSPQPGNGEGKRESKSPHETESVASVKSENANETRSVANVATQHPVESTGTPQTELEWVIE